MIKFYGKRAVQRQVLKPCMSYLEITHEYCKIAYKINFEQFNSVNMRIHYLRRGRDPRLIRELHEILMQDGSGSTQSSGQFRKVQNFIGPTKLMEDATYIPISADKIDEYMENLEYFINHHPYNEKLPVGHLMNSDYSTFAC